MAGSAVTFSAFSAAALSATLPVKVKISGSPTPTVSPSTRFTETPSCRAGLAVLKADCVVTGLPSAPVAVAVSW